MVCIFTEEKDMRRTKEDAAMTREQLLKAALVSFRNKGYIGTTLDDIARQAGTTRGAIHWHFGSKAELFNTMIRESYERMSLATREIFVAQGTPLQKLRQLMVRWMEYLEEDEEFRTTMEIVTFKTEIVPELDSGMQENAAGRRAVHQIFLQLIQKGIAEGEIRPEIQAEIAARAAEALLNGTTITWLIDQHAFSLKAAAPKIVDLYIRGLQAA
jgi:TetR/AcrR family acrAB operon transcriptional repressor